MKKEILVIFKTHLDIGFTDYASIIARFEPCYAVSRPFIHKPSWWKV